MDTKRHRVQKLLSTYGYCSRRKAEELIAAGRVTVNNEKISLGDQASETDSIAVDGKKVHADKPKTLIFHKPMACVTALKDDFKRTIMEYVPRDQRLFPIGRLDYNTTGILLLTNDGDFANKVMHPRYGVSKTYIVQLGQPLQKKDLRALATGIMLEDGKTAPAQVHLIEPDIVSLTIHEGKNRILRRMFKALEYDVIRIHREKIGTLELGNLCAGQSRVCTEQDKEKIFYRAPRRASHAAPSAQHPLPHPQEG